ncbi:Papain family cysteine protease, partial [Desulfocicer vacuolatum DSM 3385]
IDGFVDLILDDEDYHLMPTLLKGILSGVLIPDLGPQPAAIGVAVYESAQTNSTHRSGLWTIPMPGEDCLGGHAMTVVGYFDKAHPDNPLGKSYFLVRNSWGLNYAFENPLGYPGHALIPEGFFKRHDCLHSGILSVAEVSPMKGLTGTMAALWEKTRKLIH